MTCPSVPGVCLTYSMPCNQWYFSSFCESSLLESLCLLLFVTNKRIIVERAVQSLIDWSEGTESGKTPALDLCQQWEQYSNEWVFRSADNWYVIVRSTASKSQANKIAINCRINIFPISSLHSIIAPTEAQLRYTFDWCSYYCKIQIQYWIS